MLSHHHVHCSATWEPTKKVVLLDDGRTYARGLTKTLNAQFSPEFSFSLALRGVEKKAKKHGRANGNKIDKYLSIWANTGKKPKCQDPYFACIEKALQEKEWIPCASQVAVGCADLRLGTMIDLICQDLHGNYFIIELKCGFDDYWNDYTQGQFKAPFDAISISYRNRAFLQLLFTSYLYLHSSKKASEKFGGAFVLHIFEDPDDNITYDMKPLPFYFQTHLAEALTCLAYTKNQNKRQRDSEVRNGVKRARVKVNRGNPANRANHAMNRTKTPEVIRVRVRVNRQ